MEKMSTQLLYKYTYIVFFSDALCNKGHKMALGTKTLPVCDGCLRHRVTASYWHCAECYENSYDRICFNCKPRKQQESGKT